MGELSSKLNAGLSIMLLEAMLPNAMLPSAMMLEALRLETILRSLSRLHVLARTHTPFELSPCRHPPRNNRNAWGMYVYTYICLSLIHI